MYQMQYIAIPFLWHKYIYSCFTAFYVCVEIKKYHKKGMVIINLIDK